MNYTQDKGYFLVKLGKEEKMCHLGMNALKILQDELNVTLQQLGARMEQKEDVLAAYAAMGDLLYVGFKSYDIQHRIPVEYTPEVCLEWALMLEAKDYKDFEKAVQYILGLDYLIKNQGKQKLEESQQKKTSTTSKESA